MMSTVVDSPTGIRLSTAFGGVSSRLPPIRQYSFCLQLHLVQLPTLHSTDTLISDKTSKTLILFSRTFHPVYPTYVANYIQISH
jgi:hypothetical protein